MSLRDLVTDDDDQYDVGFVIWALGSMAFLVLAGVNWHRFNPQEFGIGFGSVLGGGGAMSWLRKKE